MKKLISAPTILVSFFFAVPTLAYTTKSGDTFLQIAMLISELNPYTCELRMFICEMNRFTYESLKRTP